MSDKSEESYDNVETDINYNRKNDPKLDPFEINFKPEFKSERGPREAFVNEHGVLIGDHEYESVESPLEQWNEDVDPAVMSGDEWVHPYKDIGFQTKENRDLFEEGIVPQGYPFMHSDKDVAYKSFQSGEADSKEKGSKRSKS
ncbi:DUF3905 domain-containing protein [Paenibacillus validus]|uniref:DUF3905 domain-containing protein n=1 Tax=Paenibacillus validus TaxID=44253 RepID=A0A7X3CVG2_9BACL|nr:MULTISPECIES: DUF3905 domain-containing protein [Paenibacillus]MED4603003.1 DUF3905 domain-containing protein [Paenibacillus validus]MED4608252.1 DUF3905 domain-containing protein [Paenibacillus validus]MUG73766.1 DUF3905 domain-containing protein [Paenibacillus validus]